ncbi:MAG: hypothetical protein AAFQ95_15275 [Cyanobacteria bacterium J06621_3]
MARRRPTLDIFLGILLVLVCNAAYVVTAFVTLSTRYAAELLRQLYPNDSYVVLSALFWAIFVTGFVQLLYAVPLYWIFRRKRRPEIATGIAIMAGLTLLLTASCFMSFAV